MFALQNWQIKEDETLLELSKINKQILQLEVSVKIKCK